VKNQDAFRSHREAANQTAILARESKNAAAMRETMMVGEIPGGHALHTELRVDHLCRFATSHLQREKKMKNLPEAEEDLFLSNSV
jgi:hypothetical protein